LESKVNENSNLKYIDNDHVTLVT